MADKWADERMSLTAKVIFFGQQKEFAEKKRYTPTVFIDTDYIHKYFVI